MSILLNPSEARVLGCLIEKRLSTPNNYPLTLNSLVLACNQTSNRDPVVEYDQHVVNDALINTRTQGLSLRLSKSGSRAAKFDETLCQKLELDDKRAALLAELLLRGPQTPGELRQRTTRMVDFPELEEVESLLDSMGNRTEPLVVRLPLQPGRREARYAHTLCGPLDLEALAQAPTPKDSLSLAERVSVLEAQLVQVLERLEQLEQQQNK